MNFWQELSGRARAGLVTGVAVILLATALLAWWVFRIDYQPLFTDLKPQDAQALTTELERLKIPYRLGDAGSAILVDRNAVHATRIKLMGKELPLQGAVGLELFNNTDFGMTEFAQKINYQRALQGELTRTIQSLTEVREVRVLLAMPEQGLFKQATSRPKASITVNLRQGQALRGDQITGIQRLVAAAVPGMLRHDVTIVDGHGVALTRAEGGDSDAESSSARLELKRETEAYLARKVTAVLERTFGPGQALASVDVALNMDQIRTTTEDVLPASARSGFQSTGVLVREREVLRDASSADAKTTDTGAGRNGSSQRDAEFAVGRRVEQVVSQPGTVRHIQVVAVVLKALDAVQQEQLRKVVAAAAGASPDRGDVIVVQSLGNATTKTSESNTAAVVFGSADEQSEEAGHMSSASGREQASPGALQWTTEDRLSLASGAALALAAAIGVALWFQRRRHAPSVAPASAPQLSAVDRDAVLARVRQWMHEAPAQIAAPQDPRRRA